LQHAAASAPDKKMACHLKTIILSRAHDPNTTRDSARHLRSRILFCIVVEEEKGSRHENGRNERKKSCVLNAQKEGFTLSTLYLMKMAKSLDFVFGEILGNPLI
jgi:hypothetical protein